MKYLERCTHLLLSETDSMVKQGARVRCTLTHAKGVVDYRALAPLEKYIPVKIDEGMIVYCHQDEIVTTTSCGTMLIN